MGRRKGRDISGWLIVDKPAGMTSNAVVNKVRWAFDAKKAGHAGTLDPDATGVLAIALGEATKTVPFITDALASFVGDIEQVPPQFSAVKIDGERAYKRAREGEEMALAARPLYVDELTLLDRPDPDHAVLQLVCGKGGYVRSIARDLGQALGCLGHVSQLRRIWSGPFEAEDGLSLDQIEELAKSPELDTYLRPLEQGLADLPELRCTAEAAARLRNGNPGMVLTSEAEYGDEAWASLDGKAVAVGIYKSGELHPNRVFLDH